MALTTVGKRRIASHLANAVPVKELITHIALGTDDTPESESNLALGAEIYRVALAEVIQDNKGCIGDVTIAGSDIGTASYTIKEIGFLDAVSGGNLIWRHVLDTAITLSGGTQEHIIGEVMFP